MNTEGIMVLDQVQYTSVLKARIWSFPHTFDTIHLHENISYLINLGYVWHMDSEFIIAIGIFCKIWEYPGKRESKGLPNRRGNNSGIL